MVSNSLILLLIGFTLISTITTIALLEKLHRVKKQLQDMGEALDDIQAGNGNRKILASENDLVAPLSYKMNEIVYAYEEQLLRLRKADETNRQLMTSLSHDVRTPLTTLIGYLDAAHKGIVTGKERDNYVETARHKAHDLKDYIDVLFDWFKLNSNELTLLIEPLEIAELTRNILKDWVPIFEEKALEYEIEIPEQRLMAKVDLDGYSRVINNLVQNVIAHSGATRIDITVFKKSSEIEICVVDNGVGIEKEDLQHIFERLYKCDKARLEKGSGLGLSIVRQMVEKMGGRIAVESELNKYTAFTIRLPLAS
ncbi:HAMP domain-containing sensor histidine kinase [Clostridium sp. JN-1]|uniref:sensor histidine kinase n=1 Tax=Clostridium sp. JN-1 TaxID=2483110 RepID=UPI000F0BD537|nr:HAMP domain-containing sensor histidine kinase [Clostridium sp. JN-1]